MGRTDFANFLDSAGAAGFGFEATGSLDDGDFVLTGHKTPANSLVTTDLPSAVEGRWDRVWYLDAADTSVDANLHFDFSNSGLAAPGASTLGYKLLYSPNENFGSGESSFSVVNFPATINGDTISFAVSGASLVDGYYTLGLLEADATLGAGAAADDGTADAFRLVLNGTDVEFYLGMTLVRSTPLADLTSITVSGSGDNDTLTVDYSGGDPIPAGGLSFDGGAGGNDKLWVKGDGATSTAVYTPSETTFGDGAVVVNGNGVTFFDLEPVDISGMLTASVISPPTGGSNALILNPGFDSAAGGVNPAIVVTGNTGLGTGIESAHLWNNTNVVLDVSAPSTANTITVSGNILLGHNNQNLTLQTQLNATGSVTVNGSLVVAGTLNVQSLAANLNADLAGATITGAVTTANVNDNPSGSIQDAIAVTVGGGTVNVLAGTYTENVLLNKQLTLKVAQFGVDARGRVGARPTRRSSRWSLRWAHRRWHCKADLRDRRSMALLSLDK